MMEVLIALVILSIGLLGLAGLQATGLRYNHGAYLRTQATNAAYDMADRMRANLAGVMQNDYSAIGLPIPAIPSCVTTNSPCSPAEMAQEDSHVWNTNNAMILPGGYGTVIKQPNGQYLITVTWTDGMTTSSPPAPITSSLSLSLQL